MLLKGCEDLKQLERINEGAEMTFCRSIAGRTVGLGCSVIERIVSL